MNNLIKNIAIWLVIALVLMTVFNQFSTRQAQQKAMEYSQFIEEVKQGQIAKVTIEGRVLKGIKRSGERFTTLICAEVDRITTLIDQMEHFSRGQPIACAPLNLYQPIHQAIETARARQFPGVRFAEDFDPSLPLVHGNHDAVVQILLNLITNGCEALGGRDDGVVRIATAFRHGLSIDNGDGRGRIALPIEVSVSDNGPGVPADIRGDLFDPFVTTKREGRGLGLALVAKLARDMGGTVLHMRDGEWTRFRVHLPAVSRKRRDA